MLFFILISAAVTIAVIFLLIRSMHQQQTIKLQPYDYLEIVKQRFSELERDFESGLISEKELNEARKEIEQSLLSNSENFYEIEPKDSGKRSFKSTLFLALFIPFCTFFLYLISGDHKSLMMSPEEANQGMTETPDVNAMVKQLEMKLEQQPDDIRGWHMLARSYLTLGRYDDAVTAAEKLNEMESNEPAFIVMLIDSILMSNNGQFNDKTNQLIQHSLSLAPNDPSTLWLAGMSAYQQENLESARDYWEQLLSQLGPESEIRPRIEEMLKHLANSVN